MPFPPMGRISICSGMPSSSGTACSTNGRSSGCFSAASCSSRLVQRSVTHNTLASWADSLTIEKTHAELSSKSLPDSISICATRSRWPGLAVSLLMSAYDIRPSVVAPGGARLPRSTLRSLAVGCANPVAIASDHEAATSWPDRAVLRHHRGMADQADKRTEIEKLLAEVDAV